MSEIGVVRMHGGEPVLWDAASKLDLAFPPADLRGCRTLGIDISSARATGARLRCELYGAGTLLGRFDFAADWEGENRMLMPLATLSERAADSPGWVAVDGLRLEPVSAGVWPSAFVIRNDW